MKRLKALLLVTLLTASLVGVVLGLQQWYLSGRPERWRRELEATPPREIQVLLEQAAQQPHAGIPAMVAALDSSRQDLAVAARRVLLQQVAQWRDLPGEQSGMRFSALADALATHTAAFGPAGRRAAADVAMRLLEEPLEAETLDRGRIVAACEKVLRTVQAEDERQSSRPAEPAETMPPWQGAVASPPATSGPGTISLEAISGLPQAGQHAEYRHGENGISPFSNVDLARLHGGPMVRVPADSASPLLLNPLREVQGEQPQMLEQPFPVRPLAASPRRNGLSTRDNGEAPAKAADRGNPEAAAVRPLALEESRTDSAGQPSLNDLRGVEVIELMRRSSIADGEDTAAARAELERRGFTTVHLELARRLFDADPEVRKGLARALPAVESVDAAPWLLWLVRDADAEVRLTAISLLATTGDPSLLDQVAQLAAKDSDPRIRDQAGQISRQRAASADRGATPARRWDR